MSRRSRFTRVVGFEGFRPLKASRWRTIWDLNLKGNDIPTTGALVEGAGVLTTLDDIQYHLYMHSSARSDSSWTITADTGLVVDFASASGNEQRLDVKIPDVPRLADGQFPRLRVSVAFSGLVVSNNADYVGAGIGSMWRNHASATNPGAWTVYDSVDASAPTYRWLCRTTKDTLGDASPSGTETATGPNDPNDADSGVMVIEDAGQGVFISRGHTGDTNIITGSAVQDTYCGQNSCQGYTGYNDSQKSIFWRSNSTYDGPYVTMRVKSASDVSQAITFERIVVEAFL